MYSATTLQSRPSRPATMQRGARTDAGRRNLSPPCRRATAPLQPKSAGVETDTLATVLAGADSRDETPANRHPRPECRDRREFQASAANRRGLGGARAASGRRYPA